MDQPALTRFVPLADESLRHTRIDLTNCDREPIHIPGAVQPYGFLLLLDPDKRRIVQVSANVADRLGRAPDTLLGQGLDALLTPGQVTDVLQRLGALGASPQLLGLRLETVAGQPYYKLIMHRYDGLVWLEFEPVAESVAATLDLPFLNDAMSRMLGAGSVREFAQLAAEQVRALTDFDRVSVYRFAPDESGEVIAEAIRPGLPSWLDMHYPASDIPQQARAMYLRNWLRFIPDARYQPVPLVPVETPGRQRPPDMTFSVLRSVSPIHLEYLQNLGVQASMSISIIDDGRLWGMILCHHYTPRLVSYEVRDLCQFVGRMFSGTIRAKEQQDEVAHRAHLTQAKNQLLEYVNRQEDGLPQVLASAKSNLLTDLFACGGAATCFGDVVTRYGTTPSLGQLEELFQWLSEYAPANEVFATDSYSKLNPAGAAIKDVASGLLALPLGRDPNDWVVWFRPELVQTVTWAGKNDKLERKADGSVFLSPRQSFEAWKETVNNTAAPWTAAELEAAADVRRYLIEARLRAYQVLQAYAHNLSRLNTELTRSNEELDAFAYVASHDLKEPLRGIHNYATFLLEDYAAQLDAAGVEQLHALVRLSQRMEGLIEALLQLSRLGRQELEYAEVDLNQVLDEVLDTLRQRLAEYHATVTLPDGPLPTVPGDRVRLRELLQNLITNAMRYNDRPEKRVEVGQIKNDPKRTDFFVLYVRDNGIGIDPKHHANIFRIFKRLHAQHKYGGGTGAGLTIAKRMVERHGGEMWLESAVGQGTTFYFALPRLAAAQPPVA